MAFPKAAQSNKTLEVIARFKLAQAAYSEACSIFTKIRLLADHPNASVEDIVVYHKAHRKFKEQCKEFNNARMLFIANIRSVSAKQTAMSNDEYVEYYAGTSIKDVVKQQRQALVEESVVSGDLKEIADQARIFAKLSIEEKEAAIKRIDAGEKLVDPNPSEGDFEAL